MGPEVATPIAFEIQAPNGGRALLFGSIHVARANQWTLPRSLTRELEHAEVLVLEIDPRAMSSEEIAQLVFGLGAMPQGQRLRQVVSDETWRLLEEQAPKTGQSIEQLDRLKPWVVMLQLWKSSLRGTGFHAEHGVERDLVANAPGLPIRGLETPYEQLSALDNLPFPVQDRMLRDALLPGDDLDVLMRAWIDGDGQRLEAIVFDDPRDPKLAIFYERFYYRRSARMADVLREILQETPRAFVVVGAAHLLGKRGIPSLLRASGYQVRQVSGKPLPSTRQ